LTSNGRVVYDILTQRGALFFHELTAECGLLPTQVEAALAELVAAGLATADSFAGLRALLVPEHRRAPLSGTTTHRGTTHRRRSRVAAPTVAGAGRWSLLRPTPAEDAVTLRALALLRRYGVVFRRMLAREAGAPTWRELVMVYRRLEARGEIRGGRFVAGMAGEQFALPEAVGLLRATRRSPLTQTTTVVSAADPLNLVGIVTPEPERVAASPRNRILFRDGVAVAAFEAGQVRLLAELDGVDEQELRRILSRPVAVPAPALRAYLRPAKSGRRRSRQEQD
jgi:ATP-dependent helicase Lhr and Lhr-like helicase